MGWNKCKLFIEFLCLYNTSHHDVGKLNDVMQILFHLFQRSYCEALMLTPGLELLYQGYRGHGISGLVELSNSKNFLLRSISPNTEVEILSEDYHSSYFRDKPKQILVYIKPVKNSQDWLGGVVVSMEQLLPLRIRDFPT